MRVAMFRLFGVAGLCALALQAWAATISGTVTRPSNATAIDAATVIALNAFNPGEQYPTSAFRMCSVLPVFVAARPRH